MCTTQQRVSHIMSARSVHECSIAIRRGFRIGCGQFFAGRGERLGQLGRHLVDRALNELKQIQMLDACVDAGNSTGPPQFSSAECTRCGHVRPRQYLTASRAFGVFPRIKRYWE